MNLPLPSKPPSVPPDIQTRLEKAGLPCTLATRAGLGLFLARPTRELTHAQAPASLTARGLDINRVTLYRLHGRLTGCSVLKHYTDDARTWHFSMAVPEPDSGDESAQLQVECDDCHRQFRFADASEPTRAVKHDPFAALLRLGHRGERVDHSIHGTCAGCADVTA